MISAIGWSNALQTLVVKHFAGVTVILLLIAGHDATKVVEADFLI